MNALPAKRHWRTWLFLWIGLPFFALVGLAKAAPDLVPAWKAHGGSGVTGTYTALRESCGRRSCSYYGDWKAADGSSSRTDVLLYDDPDSLRVGGTVEALDSGSSDGVFATGGGYTYLIVTGFALGGLAAAVAWPVFLWRTWRSSRLRRASSLEPAGATEATDRLRAEEERAPAGLRAGSG
ncbi:hypothetical protein [Kitasatospora phosalacinea]|uniref:hypothetical protein n=1 Tax=Kitasatospora phosalacinea TaxID=2065 RepID=UPI000525D9A2|nr:hypothetical protein [Kitasatospora phosalacinea]